MHDNKGDIMEYEGWPIETDWNNPEFTDEELNIINYYLEIYENSIIDN